MTNSKAEAERDELAAIKNHIRRVADQADPDGSIRSSMQFTVQEITVSAPQSRAQLLEELALVREQRDSAIADVVRLDAELSKALAELADLRGALP